MSQLSQSEIDTTENFIVTYSPCKYMPMLSEWDRESAISEFTKISDPETPHTSYLIFGSDGGGFTSYGYYKTRDSKIYIITAFMNNITNYNHVDETWWFLQPETQNETK